jgi:hypothetical protein
MSFLSVSQDFSRQFEAETVTLLGHYSRSDASLNEVAGCKAFGVQRFCTGVPGYNKRLKKDAGSKILYWQVLSMRVPTRSILPSALCASAVDIRLCVPGYSSPVPAALAAPPMAHATNFGARTGQFSPRQLGFFRA